MSAVGRKTTPIATFDHRRFNVGHLVDAKRGRAVSVCLPARDEESTVGDIVATVRADLVERTGLVQEVLVVDDGSTDRTAQRAMDAGARVVPSCAAGGCDRRGKGQALRRAVIEASGDLVVFLDADVHNFGTHFVVGLLGPLLLRPGTSFVKAFYRRPYQGQSGEGGRVTELLARPLVARLFPHLGGVHQPLAGEAAARRDVLESVAFAEGYGVELRMLIDIAERFGVSSLAQVDLGDRVHRNRPLAELAPQAAAVLDVALSRAGVALADIDRSSWVLCRPAGPDGPGGPALAAGADDDLASTSATGSSA